MIDNDTIVTDSERRERRPRLGVLGFGAAACVACCIGPILAVLGAITAGGIVSERFIGAAGLVIAAIAAIALVIVQWQRRAACRNPAIQPVAVHPTRRTP